MRMEEASPLYAEICLVGAETSASSEVLHCMRLRREKPALCGFVAVTVDFREDLTRFFH